MVENIILLFNAHYKYSITVGHYYGRELKTFDSKEEMIGFVIGYNEAISVTQSHGLFRNC